MHKLSGFKFCTDINSPEVLLTLLMPLIFIYYSLIKGIESGYVIIYSLILGVSIYLAITFLKNAVAWYLDSEQASQINKCKIEN